MIQQPNQPEPFHQQVIDRLGLLPNFFCSATAAPGLMEELWGFAQSAYLDNPLPSLFKERLLVYLSRFCPIRYCIVRHVGFLVGLGRPAGDPLAQPQTIQQVTELLTWPLPDADALNQGLTRLKSQKTNSMVPDVETQSERDLFEALAVIFLEPRLSAKAREAIEEALGAMLYELLTAYLAFIRMIHYWTETHPEIAYDADTILLMEQDESLAELLLNPSEAERVRQGEALRQALDSLYQVRETLRQSQQREAFLLLVSDALRSLSDPVTIQQTAAQLLGKQLGANQVLYGELIDEQLVIQKGYDYGLPPLNDDEFRAINFGLPSSASEQADRLRMVADVANDPLVSEAERSVLRGAHVGAFIAVPLIKEGSLVATIWVQSISPRWWSSQEVELVQETAERTWSSLQRARAQEALRQSEERYRQLANELETRVEERTGELRLANQDLQRSNENLQQFAYVASHDLQEPLRKIQSFSTLLSQYLGERLDATASDYLDRITKSGARMSTLIKDLLSYSRISTRQQVFGPISLNAIVAGVLETLSLEVEQRQAQVEVAELPIVNGDGSQLSQLFQNLLSNALKFTPDTQRPQVRVDYVYRQLVDLPMEIRPNRSVPFYHQINVSDEGIGFDTKYLDRIFQVFQRLHGKSEFSGTGVGLAICQRVMENHGGGITASSTLGQGATFSVYLPA